MAVEKQLKFSFVVDETSFQKVKRALQDLTAEAQKFVKATQGGAGGGGGGLFGGVNAGRPPSAAGTQVAGSPRVQSQIGQVVLENANVFKNMASVGSQAMRGLTESLRSATREQVAEIRKLEERLTSASKLLEGMRKSGGVPKAAMEAARSTITKTAGEIMSARGGLQEMLSLRRGGPGAPGEGLTEWGTGPGADIAADARRAQMGRMGRMGAWMTSPGEAGGPRQFAGGAIQGIGPTSVGGIMRVGGMIVAGAMAAVNEYMAGSRAYTNQEARRGAIVNDRIRGTFRGDIGDLQALRMMKGEYRSDLEAQTGLAAGAQARQGAALNSIKSLIGLSGTPEGLMTGQTTGAVESTKLENAMGQVDSFKQTTQFLMRDMALKQFNNNLNSRIQTGRILGTGLSIDAKTKQYKDTHTSLEARLQEQGYDIAEYSGAVQQSRQLGGRQFARAFAGSVMSAQAAGYGEYASVMAAAARGGGMKGARGLAEGAMGAGIDTTAGIQLGQTIMGTGFDPRGTTSGRGAMMAAQGGFNFTGGPQDLNQVQRIGAGLQAGDTLASGFDPYQQGRNLITAIGAAPGATTYGQDYLAGGMSMKQMLDAAQGEMTVTGKAMGLTPEMAKKQLGGMGSSLFERFVDQGGTDPMSMAIREFQMSGQELPEFMGGLGKTAKQKTKKGAFTKEAQEAQSQIEAMGAFMGREMGVGEEAGLGLAGLFAGTGQKDLKKGRGPGGGMGEVEKAAQKALSEGTKAIGLELEGAAATMKEDFGKLKDQRGLMLGIGENMAAEAKQFMESLGRLADAADIAAYRISKGQVGKPGSNETKASKPTPTNPGAMQPGERAQP